MSTPNSDFSKESKQAGPESSKNWIQILAEQSWEAELIVSGVAIFGALRLPKELYRLIDWLLIHLADDYLVFASVMGLYLYISIQVMIAGFLIHFALRVTWIGFVGLYSVYPEIKQISLYSEDFNQKLKKGFPGLKTYVKTLDDTSSVVFSAANLGVLSLLSLTLTGLVIIIIAAIIHSLLPSVSVFLIFFLLLAVLFLPSIFVSLLHLKFLREKNWVKAIH